MLSLFPSLLAFEQIAHLVLRLTLGIIFLFWAYKGYRGGKTSKHLALTILEGIIGILLVAGLYTQLAALIAAIIFISRLAEKIRGESFFTDGVNYYFILLVISLSLLLTGPGFLAFDLPL